VTASGSHYDGGRLVATVIDHDHVEHRPDGSVSAVSITGVPARVCEQCGATFYDEQVGFRLAELVARNLPAAGVAVVVEYPQEYAA